MFAKQHEDSSIESVDEDHLHVEEAANDDNNDAFKIALLKRALLEERQRRMLDREKWTVFLSKMELMQQQNMDKVCAKI